MPDQSPSKSINLLRNSAIIVVAPSRGGSGRIPSAYSSLEVAEWGTAQRFLAAGYITSGTKISKDVYECIVTNNGYNKYREYNEKAKLNTSSQKYPATVDITEEEYNRMTRENNGEFPRPTNEDIKRSYVNFIYAGEANLRKGYPADNAEVPTDWRATDFGQTALYGPRENSGTSVRVPIRLDDPDDSLSRDPRNNSTTSRSRSDSIAAIAHMKLFPGSSIPNQAVPFHASYPGDDSLTPRPSHFGNLNQSAAQHRSH
ncbi:hypothetical protein OHA02_50930 [Streptomyces phaeochromogenes]|nr:hypothetical protein [Streptomyces phaeochromogenes]